MDTQATEKKYWKSFEELNEDPAFLAQAEKEFNRDVPVDDIFTESEGMSSNRRNFLKFFGFSVSAAVLTACQKTPVKYAVPYVTRPENVVPSTANWYASQYFDGQEFSHLLVKTREGRPIKVEGNTQSKLTQGKVSARTHASVLGLYDGARTKQPMKGTQALTWAEVDKEIAAKLEAIKGAKGEIAIVTNTIISPSTQALINAFLKVYPGRHVSFDAVSASGLLDAVAATTGTRALPAYRFDNAEAIVSLNADFLGTWLNATENQVQYGIARKVEREAGRMASHYQFETMMTLSGANADQRIPMKPSEEGAVAVRLYNEVAKLAGAATLPTEGKELAGNYVSKAAAELWAHKGKALVVAGSNDANVQLVVLAINQLLDSFGNTIHLGPFNHLRKGSDADFAKLVEDVNNGTVKGLLLHGVNPVYNTPWADAFGKAVKKAELSVTFADRMDETAKLAQYHVPSSHFLESWDDAEAQTGYVSLTQPTINKIFDTRQFTETLLVWLGKPQSAYQYLQDFWKNNYFPQAKSKFADFVAFWNSTVHDGVLDLQGAPKSASPKIAGLGEVAAKAANSTTASGFEVALYQKLSIGDGNTANLPWLQELPDPITKIVWDNYICVNKFDAEQNNWKNSDLVDLKVNGKTLELPIWIQPGIARGSVAVALGYGRTDAGITANGVGKNAYPLVGYSDGYLKYSAVGASITPKGATYELATTQTHQTMMSRDIVRETTLDAFTKNAKAGNKPSPDLVSLWSKHDYNGHHWAMAIDLTACIGCGACAVSCQAENNVSIVGKDEVRRGREMHWIRIDRYYSASPNDIEVSAEHADVVFMPMMCQHCDNAPCETVCPVLATVHSDEGINQMVYNRCVGTRYCANNCPYKVRRFNWFDYTNKENFIYNTVDDLSRLVLNPDVTVRARGVMEKCSFCTQRLQAGKLAAKKDSRPLKDGEIETACSQSCPTGAIVFGDLNDPESRIAKLYKANRSYLLLEEVKTLPKVAYGVKVRNRQETSTSTHA
jgi:MoCo/4Fe-4S cofactor protein with predicted Tat translocation signal